MLGRRFGMDVENLIKQKSSNHIVLKSRSFSFDGKSKAPTHITRRTSFAQEKIKGVQLNKSIVESVVSKDKQTCLPTSILEDPQLVPHFLKDCIKHMKTLQTSKKVTLETIKMSNPDYLKKRAEIIDWLVGLHYQLKLFPQTLFISISYMDRTCSSTFISSSQFYLLAASCLLIAGKFQETYQIPNIKSIQQCSQYPLDKERMIKMEQKILASLEFNLIVQTPLKYLELLAKVSNLSQKNFCIAKYILELSLLEGSFLEFSPSIMGASVIYLVHKIRKIGPSWPSSFKEILGYEDVNLKSCAKALCSLLERSQEIQNGKNIRTKFSKTQFCCASSIRLQRKNQ